MRFAERPVYVFALLALAVGVMLHANLRAPFYHIDDARYMKHIAKRSFFEQFIPEQGFHFAPITYASVKVDMTVTGVDPEIFLLVSGQEVNPLDDESTAAPSDEASNFMRAKAMGWAWYPRLMNGVYHCIAGMLLWWFFIRVGVGANIALLIAFVWTAHPAALESVAWVCERKNTMCALWGFATLAAWTAPRERWWRWPLVSLCFTLAIFSKIAAVSFIPALIALEFFDPMHREFEWRKPQHWARMALRLSAVIALGIGVSAYSMRLFTNDIYAPPGGSAWTGLLTDADIFARYTLNSILPVWLSFFHGVEPVLSLADPRFWTYGIPLALFWFALFYFARKEDRHWIWIGFIWYFGGLGPNANIVATSFPMQDRYTYIPMPGLLLAFVFGVRGLLLRVQVPEEKLRWAGIAFAGFILLMCGIRSPLFARSDFLAIDGVAREPNSGFGNLSLAWVRRQEFARYRADGSQPDPQMARVTAQQLITVYENVEKCKDVPGYISLPLLRVERARALYFLERDAETLDVLQPLLLTSEQIPNIADDAPATRIERILTRFRRFAAAQAWQLHAESLIRYSYHTSVVPQQRLIMAAQAAQSAANSLAFYPDNEKARPHREQGTLLIGKAEIRASYLLAGGGRIEEARRVYKDARSTLEKLDPQRRPGKEAQQILRSVPEPQAPANSQTGSNR